MKASCRGEEKKAYGNRRDRSDSEFPGGKNPHTREKREKKVEQGRRGRMKVPCRGKSRKVVKSVKKNV